MPVTVQWQCDRDNATAQGEGSLPPEGWCELNCSMVNSGGGTEAAHLVLCPNCTAALPEWMGAPVFKPAAISNPVPIETEGAPGDRVINPPPPTADTGGISGGAKP